MEPSKGIGQETSKLWVVMSVFAAPDAQTHDIQCIQCRKLKKTVSASGHARICALADTGVSHGQCDGDGDACQRCLASGSECVYDKPQSSIVRDV